MWFWGGGVLWLLGILFGLIVLIGIVAPIAAPLILMWWIAKYSYRGARWAYPRLAPVVVAGSMLAYAYGSLAVAKVRSWR